MLFDDNLVHTDEQRMAVACGWLEEVAEKAQLLVFTCHPERYARCGSAQVTLF